jgi:hypothetical protein
LGVDRRREQLGQHARVVPARQTPTGGGGVGPLVLRNFENLNWIQLSLPPSVVRSVCLGAWLSLPPLLSRLPLTAYPNPISLDPDAFLSSSSSIGMALLRLPPSPSSLPHSVFLPYRPPYKKPRIPKRNTSISHFLPVSGSSAPLTTARMKSAGFPYSPPLYLPNHR